MLDHTLFAPDAVDAETAEFNAALEAQLAAAPSIAEVPVEETRRAREEGTGPAGPVILSDMAEERVIEGPGGPLILRTFVPQSPKGVYLHIHGGGWVLGRAHLQDPRNEEIANACQVAVVSVDYRLAPDHPYPAGPDDCEAAALWAVENAKAEFGADALVIGGESAGAHLSAVALLRMRDKHGFTGFSAANLVYGVYDLAMTPSQLNWGARNLVLSAEIMAWFYDKFAPESIRREPDLSPLYADLRGMPPALFTVGTLDPLLDDTLFMSQRWLSAGAPAELAVYPGGPHGFDGHPTRMARKARERMNEFIAGAVGG